jgi:hypothetical protein
MQRRLVLSWRAIVISYVVYYNYYYIMATLTVRLSDKEKEELLRYGSISQGLREGIRLYVKEKKRQDALRKLAELQKKYTVKTSSSEIVEMIREDRHR